MTKLNIFSQKTGAGSKFDHIRVGVTCHPVVMTPFKVDVMEVNPLAGLWLDISTRVCGSANCNPRIWGGFTGYGHIGLCESPISRQLDDATNLKDDVSCPEIDPISQSSVGVGIRQAGHTVWLFSNPRINPATEAYGSCVNSNS